MAEHWIKDQVAIITGGASGIGRAIAIQAARNGARVLSRRPECGDGSRGGTNYCRQ